MSELIKFPMLGGIMGKDLGQGGGDLPPLVINIAADFPTLEEANENVGRVYIAGAAVTDNDPTKTNTSQSFIAGQEFVWNGVSAYVVLGDDPIWVDDGADITTAAAGRNIDAGTGLLKDNDATGGVALADTSNPTLNTTAQSLVGAINEVNSGIPSEETELFTATAGQTTFTILGATPSSPTKVRLYVLGVLMLYGGSNDFTISGNTITWYNNNYTMQLNDQVQIFYNDSGASAPVSSVFSRVGNVIAAASDYDASQVDNDSGVSGSFVSNALDTLDTAVGTRAASGANSDITSLAGLTTPLSVAQGGTNSAAALANGKVMASVGGAVVESAVDVSSLGGTKSHLHSAEYNANYSLRRVRGVGAAGTQRFDFVIPKDFSGTLAIKLVGYPVSGAGGAGKDIDISGEYTNSAGGNYQQYTFADTTATYNTGTDDTRLELDITSLFTNLTAGTEGGIFVDHKSIGGTINYLGVLVESV